MRRLVLWLGGIVCFLLGVVAIVVARGSSLELPFLVRLAAIPVAFGFAGLGFQLVRTARRFAAAPPDPAVFDRSKPYVLYLRSFGDDADTAAAGGPTYSGAPITATEEEVVLAAFQPLGQVIAIGRPGEPLPELGAARFYVTDDRWQEVIADLIDGATLVVLRFGGSAGLLWELEQCLIRLHPEQLVVLLPRGGASEMLADELERLTGLPRPRLPRPPGRMSYWGQTSLAGYMLFDPGWMGQPKSLRFGGFGGWLSATFRLDLARPWASAFAVAFRPVYRNLGRRWVPPPLRWGRNCLAGLLFIALVVAAVFLIASLWTPPSQQQRRDEFDREMEKINQMMRDSERRNREFRIQREESDRKFRQQQDEWERQGQLREALQQRPK